MRGASAHAALARANVGCVPGASSRGVSILVAGPLAARPLLKEQLPSEPSLRPRNEVVRVFQLACAKFVQERGLRPGFAELAPKYLFEPSPERAATSRIAMIRSTERAGSPAFGAPRPSLWASGRPPATLRSASRARPVELAPGRPQTNRLQDRREPSPPPSRVVLRSLGAMCHAAVAGRTAAGDGARYAKGASRHPRACARVCPHPFWLRPRAALARAFTHCWQVALQGLLAGAVTAVAARARIVEAVGNHQQRLCKATA